MKIKKSEREGGRYTLSNTTKHTTTTANHHPHHLKTRIITKLITTAQDPGGAIATYSHHQNITTTFPSSPPHHQTHFHNPPQLKILVVLWLLSPATRGSSILYRKFVHPWLTRREDDIDNCIAQAKEQGYSAVLSLGSKGVNYATTVIMQTAIKVKNR